MLLKGQKISIKEYEMIEVKKIINQYTAALRAIAGNLEHGKKTELSKDEAYTCIEAYGELLKIYKTLNEVEKKIVDGKLLELSSLRGALDTYSDKSIAIYAYEGIQAFGELVKT